MRRFNSQCQQNLFVVTHTTFFVVTHSSLFPHLVPPWCVTLFVRETHLPCRAIPPRFSVCDLSVVCDVYALPSCVTDPSFVCFLGLLVGNPFGISEFETVLRSVSVVSSIVFPFHTINLCGMWETCCLPFPANKGEQPMEHLKFSRLRQRQATSSSATLLLHFRWRVYFLMS